jgi:hypothetical protein
MLEIDYMVKIQKRLKGNCIASFPNKSMNHYGLIDEMKFMECPGEECPILMPLRS